MYFARLSARAGLPEVDLTSQRGDTIRASAGVQLNSSGNAIAHAQRQHARVCRDGGFGFRQTISCSVPVASSGSPKATTRPAEMPSISPTARSMSPG